ncbi:MAG TPA: hypothetical protein VNB49_00180, partial [Candidatus Dormibacteraeota bacterium]|nr:hypothetical protein [Candidatus Dormibacteraeota bacterium]
MMEASEIFAKVLGGRVFEWTAEEVFGQAGEGIAGGEARGEALAEMARTKAELGAPNPEGGSACHSY